MPQSADWRHVAGLLMAVGLLASAAVIGLVFWLTLRIDDLHRETTRELVQVHLARSQEDLARFTSVHARWTRLRDVVEAREDMRVHDPPDRAVVERRGAFDALVILGSDGRPAYSFNRASIEHASGPGARRAAALWDPEAFAPLLAALRQTSPAARETRSGLIRHRGGVSFVTAAWIAPEGVTPTTAPTETPTEARPEARTHVPVAPILLAVRHLDGAWLSGLSENPYISGASLETTPPETQDTWHVLRDASGREVGVLTWHIASPGKALRADILPGLLILCVGLLGLVISASRYYHGISARLVHAMEEATSDALTGLRNRAGLDAVLRSEAARGALHEGHVALLYLDLNAFKPLNDTYGHHVGDMALKIVAQRLGKAVRQSDVVVRLGGDEFICVIFDTAPELAARRVADRVLAFMQDPITFPEHVQVLQAAMGVAVSEPGLPWAVLLQRADLAMYRAKSRHTPDPVMFSAELDLSDAAAA